MKTSLTLFVVFSFFVFSAVFASSKKGGSDVGRGYPRNGVIEFSSYELKSDHILVKVPIDQWHFDPMNVSNHPFYSDDKYVAWVKVSSDGKKWSNMGARVEVSSDKLFLLLRFPLDFRGKRIRTNVQTEAHDGVEIRHNHVNTGENNTTGLDGIKIPADPNAYRDGKEVGYYFLLK